MEAMRKAADSIRNSPLFRRKFGTHNRVDDGEREGEEPRPISPESDRTPFVQGINFQVSETTCFCFPPSSVVHTQPGLELELHVDALFHLASVT